MPKADSLNAAAIRFIGQKQSKIMGLLMGLLIWSGSTIWISDNIETDDTDKSAEKTYFLRMKYVSYSIKFNEELNPLHKDYL